MAYSGAVQVIQLLNQTQAEEIVALDAGEDASGSSADIATLMVPVPLMIYAFGVFVTEDLAASLTGSLFLERSSVIAGTDTTVVEFDLDSTNLQSGNGDSPLVTSSTGSEDIDAGDVVYAQASAFPVLITAPQYLTVRLVTTAVAGEYVPFIVARWQGMDLRPASVWANAS